MQVHCNGVCIPQRRKIRNFQFTDFIKNIQEWENACIVNTSGNLSKLSQIVDQLYTEACKSYECGYLKAPVTQWIGCYELLGHFLSRAERTANRNNALWWFWLNIIVCSHNLLNPNRKPSGYWNHWLICWCFLKSEHLDVLSTFPPFSLRDCFFQFWFYVFINCSYLSSDNGCKNYIRMRMLWRREIFLSLWNTELIKAGNGLERL